ncbi:uncharacterized protein MELLADRAFT_70125 [Melampsora larici-populina 98AG31]|uniref:Uncharacterized protein n=1 Tax=Melampsora larici-populina (strain 98AG31 / pathotype 3-4-7) TaxID=747676 RepID=F4SDP7_MELLP|nr:uncharacterized protein MELLADRAFT_70125 [Melampsora larici-populina 98AG31]EGF97231.1 hypothetical protein MELLADRAFT_70125 [Melampsora larici-populina 98AG31]
MAANHQLWVAGLFDLDADDNFDQNGARIVKYMTTLVSYRPNTGHQEIVIDVVPPASHDNFTVENGIHILAGKLIDNNLQGTHLFCQRWDSLATCTLYMSYQNLVNVVQAIGTGNITSVEFNQQIPEIATSLIVRHRSYDSICLNYVTFEVEYMFKRDLAESLGADESFIGTEINIIGQMVGRNNLSGRWSIMATEYNVGGQ